MIAASRAPGASSSLDGLPAKSLGKYQFEKVALLDRPGRPRLLELSPPSEAAGRLWDFQMHIENSPAEAKDLELRVGLGPYWDPPLRKRAELFFRFARAAARGGLIGLKENAKSMGGLLALLEGHRRQDG